MDGTRSDRLATVSANQDELLTLRHCLIEALEGLSEQEFEVRVGAPKASAEALLLDLKRLTSQHFWR